MMQHVQLRSQLSARSRWLQSGQVALVTLLMMVVILTVGLSVSTRTTQDLRLTQSEEAGGQAFQAAESGVEDAFSQDLTNEALYGQGDSFEGSVDSIEGIPVEYTVTRERRVNTRVQQGETIHISLEDTNPIAPGSQVAIDWGAGQSCAGTQTQNAASLLVRVFNSESGVWTVRNEAYAACSYTGSYSTQYTTTGQNGQAYRVLVTLQPGDSFMRIEPVFNDTTVVVTGEGAYQLPSQSYTVRSVAQNESSNETKAVEVTRSAPTYPTMFDYVLYSGTTITK